MFVLNFVISGKITSLSKVIKYVKRSKYSFHDFSTKHTPSASLIIVKGKVWITKMILYLKDHQVNNFVSSLGNTANYVIGC